MPETAALSRERESEKKATSSRKTKKAESENCGGLSPKILADGENRGGRTPKPF